MSDATALNHSFSGKATAPQLDRDDAARRTGRTPEEVVREAGQRIVSTAMRITNAVDVALNPAANDVSPELAARIAAGVALTATVRARAEGAEARGNPDSPASPPLKGVPLLTPAARGFVPLPPILQPSGRTRQVSTPAAAATNAAQKGPRLP